MCIRDSGRASAMGYNTFAPDGTPGLGGMETLGVFVCDRDARGLRVYDQDHRLLSIEAQLHMTPSGIYVVGEDQKSWRNFSLREFRAAWAEAASGRE